MSHGQLPQPLPPCYIMMAVPQTAIIQHKPFSPQADFIIALRNVIKYTRPITEVDRGKGQYLQTFKDSKLPTLTLPFFDSHGKWT